MQVHRLTAKVGEVVTQKKMDFQSDYNALVNGLIAEGTWAPNDQARGHPALTDDQLQVCVYVCVCIYMTLRDQLQARECFIGD